MMKRILYAALAVVMIMMTLVGCTTTPPSTAPAAATVAPAATDAPAATPAPAEQLEPATILFYLWGNGDEPDKDPVLAKVNEYLKTKINATLDWRTIASGDYDNKINPMLAAGEKFDLCFSTSWAANYLLNGSAGYLMEITPLLEKYGQDVVKVLGKDFLGASAIGGKQYTMPCNKEQAHAWGVLLQKKLVEKYNIDVSKVKSFADLEPLLEQVKTGEAGAVWPLLVVQGEAPYRTLDYDKISDDNCPGALYSSNDAANTKIFNEFVAPESVAMYKQMREYFKKGYINPDAPTQTTFATEMQTGKYFAITQSLKPGKDVEMSASTKVDWVQCPYFTPSVMSNRETTGSMLAIPASSQEPERTMMFCNLLYSDAYLLNLMDFGIEGTHYVKVAGKDNVIENGPANTGAKAAYSPGNEWKMGNQFILFLRSTDAPDKWQQFSDFNKSALPLKSLGFIYDGTNSQTQASACKTVVAKYYVNLFNGVGTDDIDTTVAAFKSELEAAGVDALIADMQKQYNAFLATKK